MEKTFVCDHCGETHPIEQSVVVQGDLLCQRCMNSETIICSRCGEILYRDSNAGDEDTPLCSPCFDRYYTACERCGVTIRQEDAHYDDEDDDEDTPYCYDCHSRYHVNRVIHNYYFKPEPIFHGEGPRYFGVELEIDEGGERNDYARAILDVGNGSGEENIYIKHDGSLDNGMEIVSMPASIEYHLTQLPWKEILEKARELRFVSHACSTCGLHIHISRLAFGETAEEQEPYLARILYFFEKHWEELLKFSRRTERQLDRWAARYGFKEQPQDILEEAKKGGRGGRYSCVNLENRDTIEFRIFRGTLKLNTFIATLQLVNRICDVALFLSDEELKAMSWTTFVSGIQSETTPELVQYLKERRLYVNDVVEVREEEV